MGEDILIIAATALWADWQYSREGDPRVWDLADEVFHTARKRIDQMIPEIIHHDDAVTNTVGKRAFLGHYPMLNHGIIQRGLADYLSSDSSDPGSVRPEKNAYDEQRSEKTVLTPQV